MTVSSLRGSRQAWPKQSGGGVEKVNYVVIPASERESRVSTITLLCRLRSLMQTNLFNGPVMQTVVSTLIHWILDQVEDDSIVIARKPPGMAKAIRRRGGESKLHCHSRLRAGIQGCWDDTIVIPASERESRGREIVNGFKKIGSKRDKLATRSIISKAILSR